MVGKRIKDVGHKRIAIVTVQLGDGTHERLGAHHCNGVGVFVVVKQSRKGVNHKDSRIKHHRNNGDADRKE